MAAARPCQRHRRPPARNRANVKPIILQPRKIPMACLLADYTSLSSSQPLGVAEARQHTRGRSSAASNMDGGIGEEDHMHGRFPLATFV